MIAMLSGGSPDSSCGVCGGSTADDSAGARAADGACGATAAAAPQGTRPSCSQTIWKRVADPTLPIMWYPDDTALACTPGATVAVAAAG